MKTTSLFLISMLFLSFLIPYSFAQDSPGVPPKSVRVAMTGMAKSFASLQLELLDRKKFAHGENESRILKLIDELKSGFHDVWNLDERWKAIPGIDSRLLVLKRSIDEARGDFKSGEKKLALWRLRSISSNCVACHLQTQGRVLLNHPDVEAPEGSPFVEAEFALIFKDFKKAEALYEKVMKSSDDYRLRVDALWKWVLVVSRYLQDPDLGATKIRALSKGPRWKAYEKELIKNWQKSFSDWKERNTRDRAVMSWAREFYDRRLDEEMDFEQGITVVDLLFLAGGLEDSLLDSKLPKEQRAETYLMLGHVYSKLSPGFANQFPDTYYELCIRELPNSALARSCFHGFQRLIDFSYDVHVSESRMPASVEQEVDNLHDLAFGEGAKN